ncbi:MAG: hypothetical protein U9R75_02335, partial [Candidatus Thermoplasmatota archaeon]|nr:hypothetical protein [Candidatus Thermoplasmatota archaeon]
TFNAGNLHPHAPPSGNCIEDMRVWLFCLKYPFQFLWGRIRSKVYGLFNVMNVIMCKNMKWEKYEKKPLEEWRNEKKKIPAGNMFV